jgi:hypothetical protein
VKLRVAPFIWPLSSDELLGLTGSSWHEADLQITLLGVRNGLTAESA